MIRILYVLLLLAAFPAWAACTGKDQIALLTEAERKKLAENIARHPYPEGNLWRAEKPGSTVYVVGTIHVPDPRLGPIADRATPWVRAADILIIEASSAMQDDMQRRMTEDPGIAFLTEGPTLIDLLGDELWEQLAADLAARGIPPFMGAKFQPWLLAMTLAIPTCAMDALVSGEQGLDGMLERAAEAAGTPIATLDDLDDIIGMLGAGPMDQQIDMLRIMLMADHDQDALFATTLNSYFAGRHRELWEFSRLLSEETGVADPDAAFAIFEDTLLEDRNRKWETRLPALIDGRDAVIAVGAAHLSGESGVLRALERSGYLLSRM